MQKFEIKPTEIVDNPEEKIIEATKASVAQKQKRRGRKRERDDIYFEKGELRI